MTEESELLTPLISVVIPVRNVREYLDQCLDSITEQDFKDIEIVAVDDGSTDGSRETLEARAQRDTRIKVVREGGIGPGRARNLGLAEASGEYVWFVDGDDVVATGSLKTVVRRLEHDRPDVLFVNYAHILPDRPEQPGHDDQLIKELPESVFTLAEQPRVIDLGLICWNKIINREFLRSTGLLFSAETPHEEIPLSCLILPQARRLSVLRTSCYLYRKLRPGSIMRSAEDPLSHFKIFDAFATVLSQAAKMVTNHDPLMSEQLYCAYFRRAIRHFTSIYEAGTGGRDDNDAPLIARAYRREYFERMHFEYLRYRPTGYRPGHSPLDVKLRLIGAGSYRRYEILLPVNRLRVAAMRWGRRTTPG